ncbi:MAG TPA: UDP-glucose--hexose-1-phosphate uridylyltransferase [Anaerolineae bacterium]|jgi:UDPglucose--hexose-1-phosphate uridylyltransferase|nr:UDP-glucose--hexose-1-phosphate uridylyltransferase [Anaerolineae bacterium]
MPLPTGPHRRYDPLTGQWVLVSAGRTKRPWLGSKERRTSVQARPAYDPGCYLCPGNTRVSGEQNPPYSSTYVFTNDFAALRPDVADERLADGLLLAEAQPGTCRVLCFSPRHDLTLTDMGRVGVREVVDMWADQTVELGADWRWVQIFENRGEAMGASNPHPHGQIWAGAALPDRGAREDAAQRRHHQATGQRLLLDVVAQEAGGERVVEEDDEWLALVPFWAVWPFETLLVPKRTAARIPDLDEAQRDGLARTMQRLMQRYDALFDQPMPFSMGWHQAPFGDEPAEPWQVHAHFLPPLLEATKRKFMVGYELLSEPQRDISAEDAAERLRATELEPTRGAVGSGVASSGA